MTNDIGFVLFAVAGDKVPSAMRRDPLTRLDLVQWIPRCFKFIRPAARLQALDALIAGIA
jgi:hypothetical protein